MKDNCLIITLTPDQTVLSYQVEMLHYNPQPGIIPLQKRINNQEISLHYQVGSRQSLADYYRSGGSAENPVHFLKKIVAVLQDSEDLLLYPASFLLEPDKIYLDTRTGEIALLYRPLLPGCSVRDALLRLSAELLKLIPPLAGDRPGIQEINRYLTEDFTNLAGLKKLLEELSRQGTSFPRVSSSKPFRLAGGIKRETSAKREGTGIVIIEKNEEWAGVKKFKGIFLFALSQLFIALLLFRSAHYLSSLGDPITTYAGLVLLLGALNLFLLRRLLAPGLVRPAEEKLTKSAGKKT